MAKTLPSLVRTRMGASPPKPKCENSTTDAASMVAIPASTALPPARNMRMPASVEPSAPPATAPRSPRDANRVGNGRRVCPHPGAVANANNTASLRFIGCLYCTRSFDHGNIYTFLKAELY